MGRPLRPSNDLGPMPPAWTFDKSRMVPTPNALAVDPFGKRAKALGVAAPIQRTATPARVGF